MEANLFQSNVAPRRILSIFHSPRIPNKRNRKLHEVLNWNDPYELVQQFIADVAQCSFNRALFTIVEQVEVDGFPIKEDGFRYTPESYLNCWRFRTGFHEPDIVDYQQLFAEFNVRQKFEEGQIDEIWLFGFPYAGYYESIMGGPGAFWCNAPPLRDTEDWPCRFVVMGFNYERGVGEMLENLGHRAESILSKVFQRKMNNENLWESFTRYDLKYPGQAEVGTVHFAPNSERDYDWGNRRYVLSNCDDWYNFPNFEEKVRRVNCQEWGCGDTRLHHLWWFRHFPHLDGSSRGILHNWWEYVLDPNQVDMS